MSEFLGGLEWSTVITDSFEIESGVGSPMQLALVQLSDDCYSWCMCLSTGFHLL